MELFEWPNDIEPPIHYANAQWAVTDYGIERLTDEYAIEASRLGEIAPDELSAGIRGVSDWIVHLSMKRDVDIELFVDAFRAATKVHSAARRINIGGSLKAAQAGSLGS